MADSPYGGGLDLDVPLIVKTTSNGAISAGTQTVTPHAMGKMTAGMTLIVSEVGGNVEQVTVSSVTSTTFTATFSKSHSNGCNIINTPTAQPVTNTKLLSTLTAAGVAAGQPTMWARGQIWWRVIDLGLWGNTPAPSHYDWSMVDAYITACKTNQDASGKPYPLKCIFVLQNAPDVHMTVVDAGTGFAMITPTDAGYFLNQLTLRYNGTTTNGGPGYQFDAIELGNEGYDDHYQSEPNYMDGQINEKLIDACYQTIRTNNAGTLIGTAAMYQGNASGSTNPTPPSHYLSWTRDMYGLGDIPANGTQNGKGKFDYLNFHFYNPGNYTGTSPNPNNIGPDSNTSAGGGTGATWTQMAANIYTGIQNGNDSVPIWNTEVGWTMYKVNGQGQGNGGVPDTSSTGNDYPTYITETMTDASNSQAVQKVFMYDPSGFAGTGANLNKTNAFNAWVTYMSNHATLGGGGKSSGLQVTPTSLSYVGVASTSDPASQMLTITNTGTASGTWAATSTMNSGTNWLSLTAPTSGTLAAGAHTTLQVNASNLTGGLVAGTYTGVVNVSLASQTATINVTLTVNPATGSLVASTASLSFTGTAGTTDPATQTYTLTNNTGASGTASAHVTMTSGTNWLSVSPSSTVIANTGTATITVTASNLTGNLSSGTYTGTIVYTLGSSSATVNVTLTVNAASGNPTPLTAYLSNTTSGTRATADQLYTTSGSPTFTHTYSRIGTATGYVELTAQGTTGTPSGTLTAPTGNGHFLDGSLLFGQSFVAGTWSATQQLSCAQNGDANPAAGTLVADILVRVYAYSGGVYTSIINVLLAGQTITGTSTTFTLPSVATASATAMGASGVLYVDRWLNVTGNSNGSAVQDIRSSHLSTDTTGKTGDPTMAIVSPGYTSSGATGGTSRITVSPATLSYRATQGSTLTQELPVALSNVGTVAGNWSVSVSSGVSWLGATATSGTIAAGGNTTIGIDATPASLSAGTYTATLYFVMQDTNGGSSTANVAVTMVVAAQQLQNVQFLSMYNVNVYKEQSVLIYDASGNFLDVARDVPLLAGFKETINGAIGALRVSLPREFDDFDLYGAPGSHSTIQQGNLWQFWLFGSNLPGTGLLRYQGVLDSFEPEIAENGEEKVVITLTPRSSVLADHGLTGQTPLQYGTTGQSSTYVDPVTMFTNFFSLTDPVTGLTYAYPLSIDTTQSATASGNATQFTFQAQTLASAFSSILLMLPPNWFYRCNPDTTVIINVPPTTAQHVLYVGQHCGVPQYSQDYTQLKNVAYFKGQSTSSTVNGVTTTNTISGTRLSDASLAQFGERLITASDNRVTDTATANILAQGYINTLDRPQLRTKIRIPDYRGPSTNIGYDIESLRVGDTIQMVDQSSTVTVSLWDQAKWDVNTWDASSGPALNQTAIIVSIDYQWSYVDIEIGAFQPSIDRTLYATQQRLSDYTVI